MSTTEENFLVEIQPSGWTFEAAGNASLLDAARRAGFSLPSSCRNGTCRTCMCRMLSGQVTYNIEWPGLSADEKRDGFILPCVAHANADLVIHVRAAVDLNERSKI